jgi:hypothetical protein
VSTIWNCTRKHLRERVIDMQFGCSKGKWFQASCSILIIVPHVDIACHTTSLYHSFSCRYSMSYDTTSLYPY